MERGGGTLTKHGGGRMRREVSFLHHDGKAQYPFTSPQPQLKHLFNEHTHMFDEKWTICRPK